MKSKTIEDSFPCFLANSYCNSINKLKEMHTIRHKYNYNRQITIDMGILNIAPNSYVTNSNYFVFCVV